MKNNYLAEDAEILNVKKECTNIYSVWLKSENIAYNSRPGQFIEVKVTKEDELAPVLRRPFAIADVKGDKFQIIFEVIGRGTKMLKDRIKQEKFLPIIGPLGNGFFLESPKPKLLIAGGIGIAPLKSLIDYFINKNEDITLLWGNRDKAQFFDLKYYTDKDMMYYLSTDNGSLGFEGNVLEMMLSNLKLKNLNPLSEYEIFICGPNVMMKAITNYLEAEKIDSQVSLETNMACGFGVCQGCAVARKKEEGFYLVCKDGPVFYSSKVEIPN